MRSFSSVEQYGVVGAPTFTDFAELFFDIVV